MHSDYCGIQVILLAAGNAKRMCSDLSKGLHKVGNLELINHSLLMLEALGVKEVILVCDSGLPIFESVAKVNVKCVHQEEKLGTAHAVLCGLQAIDEHKRKTLVLYCDVPFISSKSVLLMMSSPSDVQLLSFYTSDKTSSFGRLITTKQSVERIVEYMDLKEGEATDLCYSGIMLIDTHLLIDSLKMIDQRNAQKEYYLTDIVRILHENERVIEHFTISESEATGINTPNDLVTAEKIFQQRSRRTLIDKGVKMIDPDTVYLSYDTNIESGAIIYPNVVFFPGVTIKKNAVIMPFCCFEGVTIEEEAAIGPFARIRGSSVVGKKSVIGNFVEIKESAISASSKVKHLSYLGDTKVGEKTNIGAGTIICNFDGASKHITTIGADCFIGANNTLIAPLVIHDEAKTAAGSTITEDVSSGTIAIARARQISKKKR